MSVTLKQGESVSLGHVMPTCSATGKNDPAVTDSSGTISRAWLRYRLANNDLVTLAYLIAMDAR